MKKIILMALVCIVSANLFSQTYKLETVFFDNLSDKTYLSHWKLIENEKQAQTDIFSLWGYQNYFDSRDDGSYEVEYFRGNSKEVYQFLSRIVAFSEKYKNEDNIVTYISNVQVKISTYFGYKNTLVYDKEHKVICRFTLKRWSEILAKYVSYCDNRNINYK
ncbi:hypothetical protein [Paludibacter sp.]|uniref:hypothetical protein n=1 Tax=Paludibacter sp. TaxID=1898105 RepID=UPI00135488EB|nr:hypothetical protein [Paludibacter sp.]MTK53626.1 hypothetical protein [Paludibacter sp.]